MRVCDKCGKPMLSGFCIGGGEEYYCSEECLHSKYSAEEWEEMYDDGGDNYYTEWEKDEINEDDYLEEDLIKEFKASELKLGRRVAVDSNVTGVSCKGFINAIEQDVDDEDNCFIEVVYLTDEDGPMEDLRTTERPNDDYVSVNLFEIVGIWK